MKEYYKVYIANETQASSYPEPVKADFCGTIATKIAPVLLPHSKVMQTGVFSWTLKTPPASWQLYQILSSTQKKGM